MAFVWDAFARHVWCAAVRYDGIPCPAVWKGSPLCGPLRARILPQKPLQRFFRLRQTIIVILHVTADVLVLRHSLYLYNSTLVVMILSYDSSNSINSIHACRYK